MTNRELALEALRKVDLAWTMHTQSVWEAVETDVATLHSGERAKLVAELAHLQSATDMTSPLGLALIGEAGAGKTHLVAAAHAHAKQNDIAFIFIDMTDVHDFWETALQGYVNSLQVPDEEGIQQFQKLLDFLIQYANAAFAYDHLANAKPRNLNWFSMKLLSALSRKHRAEVMQHQDVIRALVLLNSNDFMLQNLGYSWLLGIEIDEDDRRFYNFTQPVTVQISQRIAGLSWLMSLRGPTLLAVDQMDSIVTQHHLASGSSDEMDISDEQKVSRAIIEGIGGGLMGLRDVTVRTLTLVSCLSDTWEILGQTVVQSFRDRFQTPMLLSAVRHQNNAEEIIVKRLECAYQQVGFDPPYPSWPFAPQFLAEALDTSPRRILQRCHHHREACLAQGEVWELTSFGDSERTAPPPHHNDFVNVETALQTHRQQVDPLLLLDESNEDDQLARLVKKLCTWVVVENPLPDHIDSQIDINFGGGHRTKPLHARLRLIFRNEGDRERHLSIRGLQRTNAIAYQSRLRSAMVVSGIDRSLSFRHLMILRAGDVPSGKKTAALTNRFTTAGGHIAEPTEDDLRILLALEHLENEPGFQAWLRSRRPVSNLAFLHEAVTWLYSGIDMPLVNQPIHSQISAVPIEPLPVAKQTDTSSANGAGPQTFPAPSLVSTAEEADPADGAETKRNGSDEDQDDSAQLSDQIIAVGHRLIGTQLQNPVTVGLEALRKHTVVLAGSGAGKTVLVKRLIEEAALLGVPSIVVDGANDLARLGDEWPERPDLWSAEDAEKARAYHQQSEVVVWTPGLETGNPLNFEPLPDLAATVNEPGELELAVAMACDSLQEIVAAGRTHSDKLKQGILRAALEQFARIGGQGLESFVEYLSDLPAEATGGIRDAAKKASDMADRLRAEILVNPLLRQSGNVLDPALLFGIAAGESHSGELQHDAAHLKHERARISVLNLSGLPGLNAQQQFLNQLAMTLFTWIKKNPAPAEQALRGLLVIDEAKDFVPSRTTTPCKSSLLRLAAQARKYGLGLIFATQEPKSIDHQIIANCATQFFGRASSPAAIAVVEEQIQLRGGSGRDVARLTRGQFYAALEGASAPVKIQAPLCLSYHAPSPLTEEEVVARATTARPQMPA